MSFQSELLEVSPYHEAWLQANNATLQLDNLALQARAALLGIELSPEPRVYLNNDELDEIPSDPENVQVYWRVPGGALELPRHQLELTRAVSQSLARQRLRRRTTAIWTGGGIAMAAGAVLCAAGESAVHNDLMKYGGVAVLVTAAISIAVADMAGRRVVGADSLDMPAILLSQGKLTD